MTSGLQMKFGPVVSAPIPFGNLPDAVVIAKVRDWALANGVVEPTDAGQVMADKIAAYEAARFVEEVRAWVQAEARTKGEIAAAKAAADYFDVE